MAEEHNEKPVASWSELFTKTLELSLGVAALTIESTHKLVNELVSGGHVAKEESHELAEKLLAMGREQRAQLADMLEKASEKTFAHMNLAKRSELEALQQRVTELEKVVLWPTAGPPSTACEETACDTE